MPLLICHRLLLILLLWVAASHGDSSDDGTYDPSMCLNQPYICGRVNISYPFYLSGETKDLKGYANSYCGYPGMGIFCDDDKPILQLNGTENYTVKSIDGASATVSLAPEVVDSSCPRVDHNVTFAQGSWLGFPPSTVDYIFFFLGCYFNSSLVQPPSIDQITCQGFDSGSPPAPGRLSFVIPDDKVPPGNWSLACNQVIQVPVLKHGQVDPKDAGWRNDGYGMVLSKGFQLTWDMRPDACMQCEQSNSNGRCAYRETGEFLGCLCSNGRMNDKNCDRLKLDPFAGLRNGPPDDI